jgi:hypothetical protein
MSRSLLRSALPVGLLAGLLVAALSQGAARAAGHPFGLGVVLGEPTGITAKVYLNEPFALQLGVGYVDTFDGQDGLHLNVDFIWHPAVIARTPGFTLPFYLGVGGRYLEHRYDYWENNVHYVDSDSHFGVRVPFGLLFDFNRVPLDVYMELALVIDFIHGGATYGPYHHDRVGWNGGIGIRYYF